MKKNLFYLLLLTFVQFATAQQYKSQNVNLLSRWDNPDIKPNNTSIGNRYSGCWGYTQKARNYAIVGAQNGTYIVDITDNKNPKQVGFVKGRRDNCVWREYKTYKNYLYCISDDASPNSFQIVDLKYLPDSVSVVHDDITILERGHAMWIDEAKAKMYISSTKFSAPPSSPMAVFDLKNPAKPTLLRRVEQDSLNLSTAHDMYVINDTCYYSGGNSGLHILYLNDKNKFQKLGEYVNYPQGGYNHSTYLLPDKKHLVMLDEVPQGLPVKVINVSDLKDIKPTTTFTSGSAATPHNPFAAINNRVVISYYEDGVQIFNMKDPTKPERTGYFDTHYQSDTTVSHTKGSYKGSWGAFASFSKPELITTVDMQNGLFVLSANKAFGWPGTNTNELINKKFADVYPNPFDQNITIKTNDTYIYSVTMHDLTGRLLLDEKNLNVSEKQIDTQILPQGVYIVKISNGEKTQIQKIIKQ